MKSNFSDILKDWRGVFFSENWIFVTWNHVLQFWGSVTLFASIIFAFLYPDHPEGVMAAMWSGYAGAATLILTPVLVKKHFGSKVSTQRDEKGLDDAKPVN